MKSFFKILIVLLISLAIGSNTNSCSIANDICAKKENAVKTLSPGGALLEVNSWTMTSKFNF